MAKMKEKIENKEDVSDRDPQESVGGVTAKMFDTTVKNADQIDEKMAKLRGDKASVLKAFEDAGGLKKALKVAMMIDAMEIGSGRDFWRSLNEYLIHLGFFNQLDMFEKQDLGIPDNNLTIKAKADMDPPAEPKSIGSSQADAFTAAHGTH